MQIAQSFSWLGHMDQVYVCELVWLTDWVLYADRYQDILHSINLARKGNPGLRSCDGHQELLKYLRSDVIEVASRLQKGGLGYMDDSMDEFEKKVTIYSYNQLTCLESGLYPDHLSGRMVRKL